MRGRYKVFQAEARPAPGIVASLRIDCWNGKGLSAMEKRQVLRDVGTWVEARLRAERQRVLRRVSEDLAGTPSAVKELA